MPYFKQKEFACKCGCGRDNIHPDTVAKLERARAAAGIPFVINSGCRCPEHNRNIGSKDNSAHVASGVHDCHAVDIRVASGRERYLVVHACMLAGFKRIGVAKSFVHVDDDPALPQSVIWTY